MITAGGWVANEPGTGHSSAWGPWRDPLIPCQADLVPATLPIEAADKLGERYLGGLGARAGASKGKYVLWYESD